MTVVNLNKARKAKARASKRTQADANSVKFGRSKPQKKIERATREKAKRELDGLKLEE